MKTLLTTNIFLLLTAFSFAGTTPNDNGTYDEVAAKMCDCVNQSSSLLSQRMINILVETDGDEAMMEAAFEKYVEEDLEATMKDVEVLQGPMINDLTSCLDRVTDEFEDVYTGASEEEVEEGILEALENMEGCESTVVFLKIGSSESSEESSETTARPSAPPAPVSEEDIFVELSTEACGCISESTSLLSSRMIEIFLEADGDIVVLEELMAAYASEDQDAAMNDANLLQGDVANELDQCMERIESDYDEVYESKSEEEIEAMLIAVLESLDGCEVSAALLKLASATE